jgi:hypothetical protein
MYVCIEGRGLRSASMTGPQVKYMYVHRMTRYFLSLLDLRIVLMSKVHILQVEQDRLQVEQDRLPVKQDWLMMSRTG